MTMLDPEPHECAGCLRKLRPPNNWLCDPCVSIAVEAGFEATPFHHPGKECVDYLWDVAMGRRNAKTT